MMFILERLTEPDIEPLTLAEAKQHLRYFPADANEDTYLEALIVAAREWVEDYTGRALIDQTWRLTLDRGVSKIENDFSVPSTTTYVPPILGGIPLRRSPALAIVSASSVDSNGVATALDPATYQLLEPDSRWPRLLPTGGSIWDVQLLQIVYRAGFANRAVSPQEGAEVVPETIKQAMKIILGMLHLNRGEALGEVPAAIRFLLAPHRCDGGLA